MPSPIAFLFVLLATVSLSFARSGRQPVGIDLVPRFAVEAPAYLRLATRAQVVRRQKDLEMATKVIKRQASPTPQMFDDCPGSTSQGFARYSGLDSPGYSFVEVHVTEDRCRNLCKFIRNEAQAAGPSALNCVGVVWHNLEMDTQLGYCGVKSGLASISPMLSSANSALSLPGTCASHLNDVPPGTSCCNA